MRTAAWTARRRAAIALLLLTVVTSARPAHAGDREDAEAAFAAGDQAYAAGQYLTAARAYENAQALYPSPSITFSIAQAYRRHYVLDRDVRWLEKARDLYERYLEEDPAGSRRAHAVTHLGNIAVLLAERASEEPREDAAAAQPTEILVSSTTPGALASIDGGPAARVPVVQRVAPGPHRVVVSAPGFRDSEVDTVAAEGRLGIVTMALEALSGALHVVAEDGAEVWIDGRMIGRAPLARPIQLAAGVHSVAVGARGRDSAAHLVTIERGRAKTLRVDLDTSFQRRGAQIALASAAGLALLGGGMVLVAANAESDAMEARGGNGAGRALTPDEAARSNAALERRDLARGLAVAGFGVAAGAGVTATLLFVFDDSTPRAAPSTAAIGRGLRLGL